MRNRRWSLARQLLLVQVAGFAALVAAGTGLSWLDASNAADDRAAEEVVAVSRTIADTPTVLNALSTPDPSGQLQPYADRVLADTGVDFVTIMNPEGIRFSHPNPALIGQKFLGNIDQARAGHVFTETYTGTLGPSMRAVVPVFDGTRVAALVAVGIKVDAISVELTQRIVRLLAVAAAVLVVGVAGSVVVGARLNRQTRGLAPAELSSVFAYYEATLHAVREGLVLLDADSRVVLCNDGARELLGLAADAAGQAVGELGLPFALVTTFQAGEPRTDEIHVTESRVLVVSTAPVREGQRARGAVVTLRDHTDLQLLTGELNTTRGLAESLRSQAHEAANRLHTVVSLVELGRAAEAVEFATAELEIAQRLTDRVVGAVTEPVLAALLLGKAAEANERGVELVLTDDTALDELDLEPRDLVTVLGNLIDNAIDAAIDNAACARPRVTVTARADGEHLLLRVADSGKGVADAARSAVFQRGWSTKPQDGPAGHGLGLALVGQVVRRHHGEVALVNDGGAVFTVRLPLRRGAGR
ncbi:ATP-binding protein [Amycolatopsis acidiphila]|uniref:histidine kinase n=1 Tax=Amycolatopsis acidiphila TaxID=715473 RepID=A0A558A0T0_9PSEU|nr:ATP-binding protein [Amycolatopsis acidiphila]TVT17862.1 GHKL domain-containing protein [Amycolatopsis acidiphila]UIJ62254.1 ATP-binding protein [Amycolatopsis acidiphila]GHG92919.1 histidine kinase [Amycolatopsis acidiphila]